MRISLAGLADLSHTARMAQVTKHFTSEKKATAYWEQIPTVNVVSNELEYNKDGSFTVVTVYGEKR